MTPYLILRPINFLNFAQTLLPYQFIYSYKERISINNTNYIVLEKTKENVTFTNPLVLNRTICYTINYSYLAFVDAPYSYIARTILNLPYKFSMAEDYLDEYQSKFILLHN